MAVISFANAKGGAGKTTAAVLLASEFARSGQTVTLLDCDPLAFASKWLHLSGHVDRVCVVGGITSATIGTHLRRLHGQTDHVIIDLSSARDLLIALAAGLSDICIVPVQGCAMDAQGAAHVLDLIRHVESNSRSRINHAVLLTRVSSMVTTRAMRSVKAVLAERRIALIDTPLAERSAYRDIFEHGGTLYSIDPGKASNLVRAQQNMQAFACDVRAAVAQVTAAQRNVPFAQLCYQTLDGPATASRSPSRGQTAVMSRPAAPVPALTRQA